jgi:cytochrome c
MRSSIVCILALAAGAACDGPQTSPPGGAVPIEPPAELADGVTLFRTHCAACHGERGAGTEVGPPLVHRIYEPAHHGDAAFQIAVARGVRAHHWRFGDMAPVAGASADDVERIVAYIRWLQRQAGIT